MVSVACSGDSGGCHFGQGPDWGHPSSWGSLLGGMAEKDKKEQTACGGAGDRSLL